MPRACSICTHPKRAEIDKALVAGTPLRNVAERFETSATALHRHKATHLVDVIVRAERQHAVKVERQVAKREAQKDDDALDVMTELKRLFARMNKLMNACDEWLTDPDDPTRYDLSPRAREVMVHYEEIDDSGAKPAVVRRKATLDKLLQEARGETTRSWTLVETKAADPRELIVTTSRQLKSQTELLAKLIGQLDERPQINFLVIPEWQALRAEIVKALRPYPEAKAAVVGRMLALKAGGNE
jgi:hypothetical protein